MSKIIFRVTNLSWFVIGHDEVWGWHKGLRQTPSAGERTRSTGNSRAGRHAAAAPIWRLATGAAHHRTTAQVVLAFPACAVGGLQGASASKYKRDGNGSYYRWRVCWLVSVHFSAMIHCGKTSHANLTKYKAGSRKEMFIMAGVLM